jgi:hypothetical protein
MALLNYPTHVRLHVSTTTRDHHVVTVGISTNDFTLKSAIRMFLM